MTGIVDFAVSRARLVFVTWLVVLVAGFVSFFLLPKEADPDIPIPIVYVGVPLEGASPADVERLVVRPLETELRTLEGLKQIDCTASQGYGNCITEFDISFDQDTAIQDVRARLDEARRQFPAEVDEWSIEEFNASLIPVVIVTLFGDAPERTLFEKAKQLQDELEALPSVLEAQLDGAREELLEVIIDPAKLESYAISYEELLSAVTANNRLIAAGALETGPGTFAVKVPGLFETDADVLELPIRASGDAVVTLGDVAQVRRTFKDVTGVALFNGKPALALQVTKRLGANIIETTEAVRAVTGALSETWPETVQVAFSLDNSRWIRDSIAQLGTSVGTAVLLVMIVVVAALGLRSGLLVGVAIPSCFLMAFLMLGAAGMSVNFMVLFGMVLAVGMLVDAGIVIVEYADRKVAEGVDRRAAFTEAGRRMFWPIVSSTGTTLAAFVPFLFWDSLPGQYMSFLPRTLIFVLTASLLMALIFLPVLGGAFGARQRAPMSVTDGDPLKARGPIGYYARFTLGMVRRPLLVLMAAFAVIIGIWTWFSATPHRAEFFLDVEPEQAFIYVRARSNASASQVAQLAEQAEARLAGVEGVRSLYTTTGGGGGIGFGVSAPPDDTAVTIFVDFEPFGVRPDGRHVFAEIERRMAGMPGVIVEVRPLENGPPVGKDVRVEITSNTPALVDDVARRVRAQLDQTEGLIAVEDTLPLPGVEWVLRVDREQAGRFGVDIGQIGAAVQLVTNGVLVGRYRPDDADEEVDIRVRFAEEARDITQLDALRVATPNGLVPIANFVERTPEPRVAQINRRDGQRVVEVRANADAGYAANLIIEDLKVWIDTQGFDPAVRINFRGADEETAEAGVFFLAAMGAALFMMAAILLLQFNNFWHVYLTLQAVVLSVTGVLLGIQLTFTYISVLMVGTGVVALAGIVVNNNIVLIDTYQRLRREGFAADEAVARTVAQRLRPVLLTTITTICGLLPMVFQVNADFIGGRITFGGPSAEWWVPLASAVVWGLGFSTLLTLALTPVLLALPSRVAAGAALVSRVVRRHVPGLSPPGPRPAE